ncbi:MAG: hypothetical protein WAO98_09440 [Alphaproteobacteria bacterium]
MMMQKASPRHILSWLIVATLIFQVLIPVGFMPRFDDFTIGGIKITICGANQSKDINNGDLKHQKAGSSFCDFALSHSVGLEPVILQLLALIVGVLSAVIMSLSYLRRYEKVSNLWARGPPLLLN